MPYCPNCGTQELVNQKFCITCGTPTSLAPGEETPLPYFPMDAQDPAKIAQLAGFWWRLLGYFIDLIILFFVVALPLRGMHQTYYLVAVLEAVAAFLYGSLFIGLANGQTIGMKFVNIQCVNARDQGRVTLPQAFRRSSLYSGLLLFGAVYHVHTYVNPTTQQVQESAGQLLILYCFLAPHFLDLLWAAWDKKNQTLHDKFAGTIVLRPKRALS